ncbi:hypothetical protein PIB30_028726 [Stylosanthes scabra]|uniref:F-box associated domain-containing protein n=1 Tax=Stylosanthes scabra TaxID=79078 RepID=A0ABU6VA93_9FABA|nr:hypothetical protein [Stylosanthes scabra]
MGSLLNDAVAFVSYMDIGLERDVHVWQLIRDSEEGVMWEKIIRATGLGIPHSHRLYVGQDIISILECRGGYGCANDTHRAELWATRLKDKEDTMDQLLHTSWQKELYLKTITLHSDNLYTV